MHIIKLFHIGSSQHNQILKSKNLFKITEASYYTMIFSVLLVDSRLSIVNIILSITYSIDNTQS